MNTSARRKILEAELQTLRNLEAEEQNTQRLAENYKRWQNRESVFMLGKAYADVRGSQTLRIQMSVPGNCSWTYTVDDHIVPSAVVTYFHNILTDEIRRELQEGMNALAKTVIEKALSNPKCVIEMLGLQSDHYFLECVQEFPADKKYEMKAEIQQEQFKVLSRFTKKQLEPMLKGYSLSHGKKILQAYFDFKGWKQEEED